MNILLVQRKLSVLDVCPYEELQLCKYLFNRKSLTKATFPFYFSADLLFSGKRQVLSKFFAN